MLLCEIPQILKRTVVCTLRPLNENFRATVRCRAVVHLHIQLYGQLSQRKVGFKVKTTSLRDNIREHPRQNLSQNLSETKRFSFTLMT